MLFSEFDLSIIFQITFYCLTLSLHPKVTLESLPVFYVYDVVAARMTGELSLVVGFADGLAGTLQFWWWLTTNGSICC
jgi:hypothetical protein